MHILVDTCIWSIALRTNKIIHKQFIQELKELILDHRAHLIGPIKQELLSGITEKKQFIELRERLSVFSSLDIISTDYEVAAEFFNHCRVKGIQGSMINFLICAVAHRYEMPIFTNDNDFIYFKKILPIRLHQISD